MSDEFNQDQTVQLYQPDFSIKAADLMQRHKDVEWLMANIMVKNLHYGVIPGSKKYSLLKAGSELLLPRFGLGCFPLVQDLSTEGEIKFMVEAKVIHIATNVHVGSGIGICSSNEEKYKWRRAASKAEFKTTAPELTRIKYGYSRDKGEYQIEQVRQSPDDIMNTILKMAKKRAQIDACLTCTAASSFFTQDIEDFDKNMYEAEGDEPAPARGGVKMPTEAAYGVKDHGGEKWLIVMPGKAFPDDFLKEVGFQKSKSSDTLALRWSAEAEDKLKVFLASRPQ